MLLGEPDAFVVDEAGVLDGRDAGTQRALDRLRAVRMRRDLASPHRRFLHHRVHLLLRELRRAHRLLFGKHAGARQHLDQIGAVLHLEAHELADLVHAVGNAGELAELHIRRKAGEIAVSAR